MATATGSDPGCARLVPACALVPEAVPCLCLAQLLLLLPLWLLTSTDATVRSQRTKTERLAAHWSASQLRTTVQNLLSCKSFQCAFTGFCNLKER